MTYKKIKNIKTPRGRLFFAIGSICTVLLGVFLYYIVKDLLGIGIPCLFHEITGFYCPGCGMTRAIGKLLELDFIEAFRYNPLIMLFPFIVYYIIMWIKAFVKNENMKIPNIPAYIILFLVIAFSLVRNIPGFEFLTP